MALSDYQIEFYAYFSQIAALWKAMPEEERIALMQWEEEYVDGSGSYGTADWPGWEKYIGLRPGPPAGQKTTAIGFVYLLRCGTNRYKIGVSQNVESRISALQTGNPDQISLVHKFFSLDARSAERELHGKFDGMRLHGEWFCLSDSDVQFIRSLGDQLPDEDS